MAYWDFLDDFIGMMPQGGLYPKYEDFGWWCLGHNFDVVATILAMAHLSWQRGWDAREVLENFFDDKEIIADFRENERYYDADNFKSIQ